MYEIIYTMKHGGRILITENNLSVAKEHLNFIKNRGDREGAIYRKPFHSTTDEKALVFWFGENCYWHNSAKKNKELFKKRI